MTLLRAILQYPKGDSEDVTGPVVMGNAVVQDANPNQFVITFNEPIAMFNLNGISFGGDWEVSNPPATKESAYIFDDYPLGTSLPNMWRYNGDQDVNRDRQIVSTGGIHPTLTGASRLMRYSLRNPFSYGQQSYSSWNSRVEFNFTGNSNNASFGPEGWRQDHEFGKTYEVEFTYFPQTMAPNTGRTAYFCQMHNADNGIEDRFDLGSVSNVADLGNLGANLGDVYRVSSTGKYYQYRNTSANVQAGESQANGLGWILMQNKPQGSSPMIGLSVNSSGQVQLIPNGAEAERTNLDVSVFGSDLLQNWSRWKIKFVANPISDWRVPGTPDSYIEIYHKQGTSTSVGAINEGTDLVHTWTGTGNTNPANWESAALGWPEHPAPGYWKMGGEYNTSFKSGNEDDAEDQDQAGYTDHISYMSEWTIREL